MVSMILPPDAVQAVTRRPLGRACGLAVQRPDRNGPGGLRPKDSKSVPRLGMICHSQSMPVTERLTSYTSTKDGLWRDLPLDAPAARPSWRGGDGGRDRGCHSPQSSWVSGTRPTHRRDPQLHRHRSKARPQHPRHPHPSRPRQPLDSRHLIPIRRTGIQAPVHLLDNEVARDILLTTRSTLSSRLPRKTG